MALILCYEKMARILNLKTKKHTLKKSKQEHLFSKFTLKSLNNLKIKQQNEATWHPYHSITELRTKNKDETKQINETRKG